MFYNLLQISYLKPQNPFFFLLKSGPRDIKTQNQTLNRTLAINKVKNKKRENTQLTCFLNQLSISNIFKNIPLLA